VRRKLGLSPLYQYKPTTEYMTNHTSYNQDMSAVSSKSSSQLVTQPTRHTVKLSNGQLVIQSTHNAASWSQSSCHMWRVGRVMSWLAAIPEDWKSSLVLAVYESKGDLIECGSYRGIKLLQHAIKVAERVFQHRSRWPIGKDNMQFGFMKGKWNNWFIIYHKTYAGKI